MNVGSKRSGLLRDLLRAVVSEYGFEEVEKMLLTLNENRKGRAERDQGERSSPPAATSLVVRESIVEPARSRLLLLAEKFDQKVFLPRVADVRNFLEIRGIISAIEQRAGSFRHILPLLMAMPEEELALVERNAEHSAPARLGPLSDAIRARGEDASDQAGDRQPE